MKIVVKGMTCNHCVKTVEEKLLSLPGISHVRINLESGAVAFEDGAGHGVEEIRDAIEDAGFEMIAP